MRNKRTDNWGFPRWSGYGSRREAAAVRPCDRFGCGAEGKHPAPKSPFSGERWHFCEVHAAEYNKNWNFFANMTAEEAARFAEREARQGAGYAQTDAYEFSDVRDGLGLSPSERAAFAVLGLEGHENDDVIKKTYRKLVKKLHPDANPDDGDAAHKFHRVQKAYEILRARMMAPFAR